MSRRDITAAELARYVGFHRSYPGWLMSPGPRRSVAREWAVAIEKVLGVEPGYLFDLDGDGRDGDDELAGGAS
jgi:hypothetical protein